MVDIIVLIVLAISILGIAVILYRKIPILAEFSLEGIEEKGILTKLREEIKHNIAPKTASSGQTFLLKVLSKARVLFLKGENQIAGWLDALRQRKSADNTERGFSEGYWDRVKIRRGRKPKVIIIESEEKEENES
jgi:hypothetical protein